MGNERAAWRFWVDRGGTFTDIVARRPDGGFVTAKLLSENPERYADAALQGIGELLELGPGETIPAEAIVHVKMGTTVGTNALLERAGERLVLATTRGFADALRIGYQNRPDLFALDIQLPELLHERVVEIDERLDARGEVLRELDLGAAERGLRAAFDDGIRAVAILLLHGYRYPAHERALAELAGRIGFTQISTSHQVSPLMKLVGRGDTTVVDAYLSPLLRRYVDGIAAALGDTRLMFMQSSGGLTDARLFQGRDCILSGPAGGVVGAVRTAADAGHDKIIGFDMGGTSTDVSHYAGEYERAFETEIAGVRMRAPMMHIHTVAAGGGSILGFDGRRFQVGPESAGANPGPTCYRRGGPLAVTDCNVMLGRLQPAHFPRVFGPGADQPLDTEVVREKFTALAAEIGRATGRTPEPEAVAEGFLTIAVENMANAIKKISIERGYDVAEYTLVCFGGAGGQHACRVADSLSMTRILIHPFAGVLSALGIGLADVAAMREASVEAELSDDLLGELETRLDTLAEEARAEVVGQGVAATDVRVMRRVHLRYAGTDTALVVPHGMRSEIVAAFEVAHRAQFGFVDPDRAHLVEAISLEAVGGGEALADAPPVSSSDEATPIAEASLHIEGNWTPAPIFERADLGSGVAVDGPAILKEVTGTTVVEPGWRARCLADGQFLLERVVALPKRVAIGTDVDPVMLEIFNNLFMSIAEQMGVVLANTSYSVNIKERLDFSCAVFDGEGELIANAPHIPVHLGSMSESIKSVIRDHGEEMYPGDVFVQNAPYNGGTHLPDVTVIQPVFDAAGRRLFYVGARGHHADIGGITPGSMPPFSKSVEEEGILFDNLRLVDRGRFLEAETRAHLATGPWPSRAIDHNIADLKAQIAACEKGRRELLAMVETFGHDIVAAYMGHVQDNAEESVRRVIDRLGDGDAELAMDDGSNIRAAVRIDRAARSATIDFTGTSAQLNSNYNAPTAVCRAAVLFAFRTLVRSDIPLNAGCLKPIRIVIPEASMLNPRYPAAVVAGNVETSTVITDCLFAALGVLAGSQGTMNNFTFGNDHVQYYETICGGAGAGAEFDGASAVHTHMTNSRLTDPEVLEWRFPVQLEEFSILRGGGGAGRHRGGDGVRRVIRFLEPMTASMLANRRAVAPQGLAGGGAGRAGRNWVERVDGSRVELAARDSTEVGAGDLFVIETPAGGGFGPSDEDA